MKNDEFCCSHSAIQKLVVLDIMGHLLMEYPPLHESDWSLLVFRVFWGHFDHQHHNNNEDD